MMTAKDPNQPNPGSPEAIEQGCRCPNIDNHHGAGMPYPSGPRWWISGDCPMHGHYPQEKEEQ